MGQCSASLRTLATKTRTSTSWKIAGNDPVCAAAGFYIVTYALGIFNLNMLLGFLTPQVDPELEGPTLPSKKEDEFRPFVRRLPEFKFWCAGCPIPCTGQWPRALNTS